MPIRKITLLMLISILGFSVFAQEKYYPLHNEINIRIEKALFDQDSFYSNIKPYKKSFERILDSIENILNNNSQNSFFDRITNKSLILTSNNAASFQIDPFICVLPTYNINTSEIYDNYGLGLSLSGKVGKKFGFFLNGFYGTKSFPKGQETKIDSTGSLPHFGRFVSKNGDNYNYLSFTGYLDYSPTPFLNFNLGYGKHFWGDGYRSLFLSENSASYPYFRMCVDVWKFKYLWLFGTLFDKNPDFTDNKLRPKFLISHILNYNVNKWLDLSVFESIVSNPTDSVGLFNLNPGYLNPVIFLRPVEFSSGSADNALLGFSFKLKIYKKYQLYSQILLDEFVLHQMVSDKGWWGNKYGIQAGLKIFDFLNIKNLFSRFEFNMVRPYTYSSLNSFENYGNQSQALAHPLGANFGEIVVEGHYHYKRLSVYAHSTIGQFGEDVDSVSYGQDIYKSYALRTGNYGIKQDQGYKSKYIDFELKTSFLVNAKMNLAMFVSCQYKTYNGFRRESKDTFICIGISSLLLNDISNSF